MLINEGKKYLLTFYTDGNIKPEEKKVPERSRKSTELGFHQQNSGRKIKEKKILVAWCAHQAFCCS